MNTSSFTPQTNLTSSRTALAPARISYVAALFGLAPRPTETHFTYAQIGCATVEDFLCLAASNPEGRFTAVVQPTALGAAEAQAGKRRVSNATFVISTQALSDLDYLVVDTTATDTGLTRSEIATLAGRALRPSGILVYRYKAYPNADETLRFIVNEFAPEMNVDQSRVFLTELKALGSRYFAQHPIAAATLSKAIAQDMPDEFFSTCDTGTPSVSGSFDTLVAMQTNGLSYAGDAEIRNNYIAFSAPVESHPILDACRTNHLFEPLKDFVLQRLERCDIWVRNPVEQTDSLPALYNGFTFGIPLSREQIPAEITINHVTVDLTKAPYADLIDMMTTMPISVGDFLHQPQGQNVNPVDVIGAIQVLVALGLASPMRSSYAGQDKASTDYPQWATGFNSSLQDTQVSTVNVLLASPVMGTGLTVSARDALVIQAINRVGMKDSVSALLPELQRVANDPALASQIMDTAEPTAETAHNMIVEVVNRSMIQWVTYGLLAA